MLIPKKVKHRKWSRFCPSLARQQNRGSSVSQPNHRFGRYRDKKSVGFEIVTC